MSLAALDNVLHRDAMQRRFHGDLRVRAVETLLFEGIPITRLPIAEAETRTVPVHAAPRGRSAADRVWTEETAAPRVHLYGNGRYALMVTNSGGGYSRWNEFDVTRWRSDTTLDPLGQLHLYSRPAVRRGVGDVAQAASAARAGEITGPVCRGSRRNPPARVRH